MKMKMKMKMKMTYQSQNPSTMIQDFKVYDMTTMNVTDKERTNLKNHGLSLVYVKGDKRSLPTLDCETQSGAEVIYCFRKVYLVTLDGEEKGEFTISGTNWVSLQHYDSFNGRTNSMSISIDEELQGNGFARLLIRYMAYYLIEDGIAFTQKLFIDGDGSDGFWDSIGMIENPYGYDFDNMDISVNDLHVYTIEGQTVSFIEGKGYEKVITLEELCRWAFIS